jgi:penicillin-binding protein 2
MQILSNDDYEEFVERKRRRIEIFPARRGTIYDRNGRVLATDVVRFDLSFVLSELDPQAIIVPLLAKRTGISEEEISQRLAQLAGKASSMQGEERSIAQVLLENLTARTATYLNRLSGKYPERYGSLIVEKGQGETYNLCVIVPTILRMGETLSRVSRLTGVPVGKLSEKVEEVRKRILATENRSEREYAMNIPYTLARDVSKKMVIEVEVNSSLYPGIAVTTGQARVYPNSSTAAHVIGHLRQINKKEYKSLKAQGRIVSRTVTELDDVEKVKNSPYFIDDSKGVAGVEAGYDEILTGCKGARVLQKDSRTPQTEVLIEVEPESGKDIYLTIDLDVQREVESALASAGVVGAAVVLSVEDGEILAIASSPSFDLSTFRRPDVWRDLQKFPYPMLNRAILALVPGSGFKVITAVAGLEELHDRSFQYTCRGYYKTPASFRCWKREGHGTMDITSAIEQSCNVYFYALGEKLGQERLRRWSALFGIGERTGIDIPGEASGLLPSPEWKAERAASSEARLERLTQEAQSLEKEIMEMVQNGCEEDEIVSAQAKLTETEIRIGQEKERLSALSKEADWVVGDTRYMAIGQGNVLASPLQMAQAVAIIATGGKVYRPHLVRDTGQNCLVREIPISEETLRIVRNAMSGVVSSASGTAHGLGLDKFHTCAKTGTAEIGGGLNNAWIIGYAPAHIPEVAFAVVAERVTKHGGELAGPIAEKVLAVYFRTRESQKK